MSLANRSLLGYGAYSGYPANRIDVSWIYNPPSPDPIFTSLSNLFTNADNWGLFNSGFWVQFCPFETIPKVYLLHFNFVIISIVIIGNIDQILIMTFTTLKMIWQPLITICNRIAIFLVELNKTIKNICLLKNIWNYFLTLNLYGNWKTFDGFKVLIFISSLFAMLCKLSYLPLYLA